MNGNIKHLAPTATDNAEAVRMLEEWLEDAKAGNLVTVALVAKHPGCDHCNHPMYCGVKCGVCGRWTEQIK